MNKAKADFFENVFHDGLWELDKSFASDVISMISVTYDDKKKGFVACVCFNDSATLYRMIDAKDLKAKGDSELCVVYYEYPNTNIRLEAYATAKRAAEMGIRIVGDKDD